MRRRTTRTSARGRRRGRARTNATARTTTETTERTNASITRRVVNVNALKSIGVGVVTAMMTSTNGAKASAGVVELTPENFASEVANARDGVFVEFYAPWCPYCKRLEPIWNELPEKLAQAGSKTRVARMNVDAYADYARAYAVTGFPTLMLFENGRPVGAKTGLIDLPTAMKYAGVKDDALAQFEPVKELDKILNAREVQYISGELGEVRKELQGLSPEARARAFEHLSAVESLVGVRSL